MKKIIGVILTLIAFNSFAGKIPEAKSLQPELYTIQFTYVKFPTADALKMSEEEERIMQEYNNLLEELEGDEERDAAYFTYVCEMRKAKIDRIESSEGEYTDLATIYTSSGERLPKSYSNIKGMLDVESNSLVLGYKFPSVRIDKIKVEQAVSEFRVNEWFAVLATTRGGGESGILLVKCYPPTNVPSNKQVDPIVTTPVDKVEAQSTQGHP